MTTYKLDLVDDKLVVTNGTIVHCVINEFETAMLYSCGKLEINGVELPQTVGLRIVPGGKIPTRCRNLGFFELARMLVVIRASKLRSHEIIDIDNTNRPGDIAESCMWLIKCVCETQCIGFYLETKTTVDKFDDVLTGMKDPTSNVIYTMPFTLEELSRSA